MKPCVSFEQAAFELSSVISDMVDSGKGPMCVNATPMAESRWHRWLFAGDLIFASPEEMLSDSAEDIGIPWRDHAAISPHPRGGLCVMSRRIHTLTRRDARVSGAVRVPNIVFESRQCVPWMRDDVQYYSRVGGKVMNVTGKSCRRMSRYDAYEIRAHTFHRSIDLTMRYEWQVSIGHDGASGQFPVSRASVAELFSTRDKLPGRSRRSALLHFVSAHTRRRKLESHDPSDIDVRRYVRGQEEFSWNGLDCRIIPPAFDVEAIKEKAS